MLIHLRKQRFAHILTIFLILFFFSCKKDINNQNNNAVPDLTTKISTSVSGFVTDENDQPVIGAAVKAGMGNTTTNQFGYFELKNVELVKTAAFVTITRPGYFNATKTWGATENKTAFFRIKLLPKTIAGTINSSSGGNVVLTNGLMIALPADAVMVASNNTAYAGDVKLSASWINPEANDLNEIMPGDLRGIDASGFMKGLTTYGMAAVELTGSGGELLQIAPGKKATITMPLSSTLTAAAPTVVPLWYFDENNGLWKEDGVANKTGNTFTGNVSHFSYWNIDVPNPIVPLTFTVVDPAGNPIANAWIDLTATGIANGYTDNTGYVSLFVSANSVFTLRIYGMCTQVYEQQFYTTTSPINLGNIIINSPNVSTITASVVDCNNNPVSNGIVIFESPNIFGYGFKSAQSTDANGLLNFRFINCTTGPDFMVIAQDLSTMQQSTPATYTLVNGTNSIGTLQACGTNTQEYMNYNIDGANYSLTMPADSVGMFLYTTIPVYARVYARNIGYTHTADINWLYTDVGLNSLQPVTDVLFSDAANNYSLIPVSPVFMQVTEYGAVGEFISGNFSGSFINQSTSVTYNISCNFRVRRTA